MENELKKLNESKTAAAAGSCEKLTFPKNPGIEINAGDIVCVFCSSPFLMILLKSGEIITVEERLKNLLSRLDRQRYWKPHKSYILSRAWAMCYFVYGRGLLIQMKIEGKPGKYVHIPVARRLRKRYENKLDRFTAIVRVIRPKCTVRIFKGKDIDEKSTFVA